MSARPSGVDQIETHASCMFLTEQLPESWIESCADYLRSIFGKTLEGKTVLDYGFGRGNWSLAFLAAGARRLVAVDAASSNVERFRQYCQEKKIGQIDILQGNILKEPLKERCDILWLYGILHHIPSSEIDLFLDRAKALLSSTEGLIFIYFFNSPSLRETIISLVREMLVYQSEEEFRRDSYLFPRSSLLRARDDLTAPSIQWFESRQLQALLNRQGIKVIGECVGFQEFLQGVPSQEFAPHHFLCTLEENVGVQEILAKEPTDWYPEERDTIRLLAKEVFSLDGSEEEKKHIAIGLFNSYFSFLTDPSDIRGSLIETFLFLLRIIIQEKSRQVIEFSTLTEKYAALCLQAMRDENRESVLRELGKNLFTDYLRHRRVRL